MTEYTNLEGGDPIKSSLGALRDEFDFPPFSVWDARSGQWQARKLKWLSLGIQSEVGRGDNLLGMSDTVRQPDKSKRERKHRQSTSIKGGLTIGISMHPHDAQASYGDVAASGTSIFDPVICELFYSWFVPKGGAILDPFAGGSVRGILASRLGRVYCGIDVRKEQVAANEEQAKKLCVAPLPVWKLGDSRNLKKLVGFRKFDGIFSCPPYGDLEQYSDDPNDLSNMGYDAFLEGMGSIVDQCADALKPNRFACFVIADVRDKAGFYRGLVVDTILMFERAGLRLYNQAILVTSVGSLSIRVKRMFAPSRKLGNSHQHVLIFVKGDPRKAVEKINGN